MFRVLVTGVKGQVGSLLFDCLSAEGYEVRGYDYAEMDITSLDSVMSAVNWKPDLIINAAAYTAVDKAEADAEKAFAVNADGVKNLLALAKISECPLIGISTDYVFNGQSNTPYKVETEASPLGVYGASKRLGEELLENSNQPFINIRTSWVFGENGNNFVKTMLRLGKDRDSLSIVSDQVGCPTYAGDLAKVITVIARRYKDHSVFVSGHYHYCGDVAVNWHEFAEKIFDTALNLGVVDRVPDLNPISTSEFPTAAERPAYSVLDCSKLKEVYNLEPSDWSGALRRIIPIFYSDL